MQVELIEDRLKEILAIEPAQFTKEVMRRGFLADFALKYGIALLEVAKTAKNVVHMDDEDDLCNLLRDLEFDVASLEEI